MIKKLQRKFIMITMGSLLLVMLLLMGTINGINLYQMQQRLNGAIAILSQNQGKFPKFEKKEPPKGGSRSDFEMNEETQFATRYFVVRIGEAGDIMEIDTSHIAISSEAAMDYATQVLSSGKESGYLDNYKYSLVWSSDGYMLIFVFCKEQIATVTKFLFNSCAVAVITFILMFLMVSVFSRRAIKPIIENAEKQKQFITDAGHEIKTPIAIISANADVLELTGGSSEWITSIRNQISRLDKLVKNLLMLSRMEEDNLKLVLTDMNLSRTVEEIAGSFQPVAEMQDKKFQLDIQPGLMFHGDENSIQQLVSTLVDNAMKYSNEGGIVGVTLSAARKGVKLEVYNTVFELDTKNLDKLFDRFYRADASRARETGGYGIGLSIAKSIVEAHHGKIGAKSDDGRSIIFTVIL
ncbi:HAMP domain-containing sensor histidine kinase [Kineothrix sedimenti]|uniref:histidine kinase n=1 Tax=Kineothrix sedimenti TaxID=3123317 RepID=A0ABZ3EYN7_9FIRM